MPVIKWAPHNLLTYSEQFDNAAWTKTNTAITANALASPDGTQTADLIKESTNNAEHFILQSNNATAGVAITGVAFAKAQSRNFFRLAYGSAAGNPFAERVAWFNLSDGSLGTQPTGDSSSSITSLGNGWYLCSLTIIPDNSGSIPFVLAVSNADYGSGSATYTGDGSSGIYAWGAHLYRSDLGGMADNPDQPLSRASYVPTTSAAKYLPRVGHHVYNGSAWVNEGVLAESESRVNLQTTQNWSSFTTAGMSAGASGYDGASPTGEEDSAYLFVENTSAGLHRWILTSKTVTSGSDYTISVYAKDAGRRYFFLREDDADTIYATFDLQEGVVFSTGGADVKQATIEPVGNDWYRCSVTGSAPSTNFTVDARFSTDGSTLSYTGDGASGIYFYGIQLEAGSTPSSLIPTSGSSVTRAAETFTIPSANLPWPTPQYIGSELVTNGTFDTDISGWTIEGEATATFSSNTILVSGSSNPINGGIGQQLTGTVSGKVYEVTFDLVAEVGTGLAYVRQGSNISLGSGTNIFEESSLSAGTHSTAFVASQDDVYLLFYTFQSSGATRGFTLDNISVREINPLSVSIGMEGRITYADENSTSQAIFWQWRDDVNNRLLQVLRTNLGTGELQTNNIQSGTADEVRSDSSRYSPDVLVPFDIASRHGSTFVNAGTEGVALTANTTPTALPDLSSTDLDLVDDYMGTVSEFRVWDKDIGDAGLVEATEPSLEPSLSLTFEGVGTNSFVVNDWSQ